MKMTEKMKIAGPIKLPALLENGEMGDFRLYLFSMRGGLYYVLEKGDARGKEWPLLRVHSACNIAHIFHSQRCDCYPQLRLAMSRMEEEGCGLLIYVLNHEGRAVGAFDHMRVYQKQDEGFDTVDSFIELGLPVDKRKYNAIKPILDWFNIRSVRLLTNNPKKIEAMERLGFEVKREPLIAKLSKYNQSQISVKVKKLGHLIPYPDNGGD